VINVANNQLILSAPVVFNPAPDGLYFRQHATLEYAEGARQRTRLLLFRAFLLTDVGNYWKEMNSLIPSHVLDGAQIFISSAIQADTQFTEYLEFVLALYAVTDGIVAAI
jgi:hypothetical protein